MTELNTKIELIVSKIIGATRKANTLEDLGKANTNGINDITDLVKNLALSGVVKSFCGCKKPKPNYPEMVWCDDCTKEIKDN